jgi:hypothetical protein
VLANGAAPRSHAADEFAFGTQPIENNPNFIAALIDRELAADKPQNCAEDHRRRDAARAPCPH